MAGAGIDKSSSDDVVTDGEKQKLLAHIRSGQAKVSAEPAKVTLRRKSTSTIKAGASAVNVEVRKKRTYVHRDLTAEAEKQREIEDAKVREEQEAEEWERREVESVARAVEAEASPKVPVSEESALPVEEAVITAPIVEPPPPPKEDDGRRHKNHTYAVIVRTTMMNRGVTASHRANEMISGVRLLQQTMSVAPNCVVDGSRVKLLRSYLRINSKSQPRQLSAR